MLSDSIILYVNQLTDLVGTVFTFYTGGGMFPCLAFFALLLVFVYFHLVWCNSNNDSSVEESSCFQSVWKLFGLGSSSKRNVKQQILVRNFLVYPIALPFTWEKKLFDFFHENLKMKNFC